MAIILVNKDGSSNAKAGDYVVTGGGVYRKMSDGPSVRVMGLDTPTGSSSKMSDVVTTFNRLTSGSGSGGGSSSGESGSTDKTKTTTDTNGTEIYDSAENYDSYTLPLSYDYSSGSYDTSGTLSKVVGYAVVGLVLLVVADRLIGKAG